MRFASLFGGHHPLAFIAYMSCTQFLSRGYDTASDVWHVEDFNSCNLECLNLQLVRVNQHLMKYSVYDDKDEYFSCIYTEDAYRAMSESYFLREGEPTEIEVFGRLIRAFLTREPAKPQISPASMTDSGPSIWPTYLASKEMYDANETVDLLVYYIGSDLSRQEFSFGKTITLHRSNFALVMKYFADVATSNRLQFDWINVTHVCDDNGEHDSIKRLLSRWKIRYSNIFGIYFHGATEIVLLDYKSKFKEFKESFLNHKDFDNVQSFRIEFSKFLRNDVLSSYAAPIQEETPQVETKKRRSFSRYISSLLASNNRHATSSDEPTNSAPQKRTPRFPTLVFPFISTDLAALETVDYIEQCPFGSSLGQSEDFLQKIYPKCIQIVSDESEYVPLNTKNLYSYHIKDLSKFTQLETFNFYDENIQDIKSVDVKHLKFTCRIEDTKLPLNAHNMRHSLTSLTIEFESFSKIPKTLNIENLPAYENLQSLIIVGPFDLNHSFEVTLPDVITGRMSDIYLHSVRVVPNETFIDVSVINITFFNSDGLDNLIFSNKVKKVTLDTEYSMKRLGLHEHVKFLYRIPASSVDQIDIMTDSNTAAVLREINIPGYEKIEYIEYTCLQREAVGWKKKKIA
jgi:hypothetical protein